MSITRTALLVGAAAVCFPVAAHAQDGDAPDETSGTIAEDDPQTIGVRTIIVTAQRREESLQDVPLAISALVSRKADSTTLRTFPPPCPT